MSQFGPVEDGIPIPDEGPSTIFQALKELNVGQSRIVRMYHPVIMAAVMRMGTQGCNFFVLPVVEGTDTVYRIWRIP